MPVSFYSSVKSYYHHLYVINGEVSRTEVMSLSNTTQTQGDRVERPDQGHWPPSSNIDAQATMPHVKIKPLLVEIDQPFQSSLVYHIVVRQEWKHWHFRRKFTLVDLLIIILGLERSLEKRQEKPFKKIDTIDNIKTAFLYDKI